MEIKSISLELSDNIKRHIEIQEFYKNLLYKTLQEMMIPKEYLNNEKPQD